MSTTHQELINQCFTDTKNLRIVADGIDFYSTEVSVLLQDRETGLFIDLLGQTDFSGEEVRRKLACFPDVDEKDPNFEDVLDAYYDLEHQFHNPVKLMFISISHS